jgi:hypothetical protein
MAAALAETVLSTCDQPSPAAGSLMRERSVSPHVRGPHKRRIGDREVPVRPSIVNQRRAREPGVLATLVETLRRTRAAPSEYTSQPEPVGRLQLDLFAEHRARLAARANKILADRVDHYARLRPIEAAHLAMARVRVHVARASSDVRRHDLELALNRLEEILFAQSLQRLDGEEAEAVREACVHRQRG